MPNKFNAAVLSAAVLTAAVLGAILTAGIASVAAAQADAPPPPPQQQAAPNPRPHDPAKELAELTRKLKLSAEQQTEIKPILLAREASMQALLKDEGLTREQRMDEARTIMDDSRSKIEAVLDDSQRQKFEREQQAMQRHARRNHGNSFQDDGPDGPPPDDMGPPPDGPPPDGGGPPPGQ